MSIDCIFMKGSLLFICMFPTWYMLHILGAWISSQGHIKSLKSHILSWVLASERIWCWNMYWNVFSNAFLRPLKELLLLEDPTCWGCNYRKWDVEGKNSMQPLVLKVQMHLKPLWCLQLYKLKTLWCLQKDEYWAWNEGMD